METAAELSAALWPADRPTPTRVIRCRGCGQRNRVAVPTAVFKPRSCRCGRCGEDLFLPLDAALDGLSPTAYEHDLDRKSLAALKAVPGFPQAVRWLIKNVGERTLKLLYMANAVHCHELQFPELAEMLDTARRRLGMDTSPTLFVSENPHMNAMTMGVEDHIIVVYSALLDQMDDTEVTAVLAHELGHVHADHVLYKSMARMLLNGGALFSSVVRVLTFPLQKALAYWDRCSELSSDRAALLATRDLGAALSIMMKFSGGYRPGVQRRTHLRLGSFVQQSRALAELENATWLDTALSVMLTMDRSHPFAAWRVMHLIQWVESGNYLDILAGDYERVSAAA